MTKSEIVFLVPGPNRLFWDNGAYYLWELSKYYTVVIFVDSTFEEDARFQSLLRIRNSIAYYFPVNTRTYIKHRFFSKEIKKVTQKYKPTLIIQHNSIHIQNMYINYWGKKFNKNCLRIVYQNSRIPIDLDAFHSAVGKIPEIDDLEKFSWVSLYLRFRNYMRNQKAFFVNYWILPFFYIQKIFFPSFNSYILKQLRKIELCDYMLFYSEIEKKSFETYSPKSRNFFIIEHPLVTSGKELIDRIYKPEEELSVLFMPSALDKPFDLSELEYKERLFSTWESIVDLCIKKFEDYNFYWKNHPHIEDNSIWILLADELAKKFPMLKTLSKDFDSTGYILNGKIVISNASSVLWWTTFLDKKVSISFDILDGEFEKEMKYYPGIICFTDLSEFENFDFKEYLDAPSIEKAENKVTLMEFISDLNSSALI